MRSWVFFNTENTLKILEPDCVREHKLFCFSIDLTNFVYIPHWANLICLQTWAGLVDKNKNKRISSVSKQLTWCVEVVLGSILVIIELDAGKNCNLSSRSAGNTSCNSILERTHSVCLNKINDATVIWRHFIKIQHLIYPAQPLVYIFPRELWSSKISNGVN